MAGWLMFVVAIIYVFTAIDLSLKGHYGMALAFLCYAISNIGMYLANKGI